MLEIQKFVKACKDVDLASRLLWTTYRIQVRKQQLLTTNGMDYVYLYNYTSGSPLMSKIADEANGLILNSRGILVCRTFDRVTHLMHDPKGLNWDTTVAEEKLPGIVVTAFNYRNNWCLATKHDVNGADRLHAGDRWAISTDVAYTLEQLRAKTEVAISGFYPFALMDRDLCFSLIYSRPKIRRDNNEGARVHLIEVYNKKDGTYKSKRELDEYGHVFGFERPKRYIVENLSDVNTTVKTTGGDNNTGFIVSDGRGIRTSAPRRGSTKTDEGTKTNMSMRYLIESALMGKTVKIPREYSKMFSLILKTKTDLLIKINTDMAMITNASKEEKKRRIKGKIIESAMMTYLNGEASNAKEVLQNVTNHQFLKIIRLKHWREYDEALKAVEQGSSDIGELLYG